MKTPMEISLERIKIAIEKDYIEMEAIKNRIEGMKIAERHIEEAVYQEKKDKENKNA